MCSMAAACNTKEGWLLSFDLLQYKCQCLCLREVTKLVI